MYFLFVKSPVTIIYHICAGVKKMSRRIYFFDRQLFNIILYYALFTRTKFGCCDGYNIVHIVDTLSYVGNKKWRAAVCYRQEEHQSKTDGPTSGHSGFFLNVYNIPNETFKVARKIEKLGKTKRHFPWDFCIYKDINDFHTLVTYYYNIVVTHI